VTGHSPAGAVFCAELQLHLGTAVRYSLPREEQGSQTMIVKELTEQECANILRASNVGHLACASGNQPYVVPVTFAFADNCIYSFSLSGQKIDWMRQNPQICLQVGDFKEGHGWKSVIVYGVFEELPDRIGSKRERDHAWSLLSRHANWWEPGGLKPVTAAPAPTHLFYRIRIERVTGRQTVDE
jgi:nitroimidazol reductase NimA-like FMN-containing flavoprotein (pyridoxamine 5'-phosphate oxidase superfamily)